MSRLSEMEKVWVEDEFWTFEQLHAHHVVKNPFVGRLFVRYLRLESTTLGGYVVHVAALKTERESGWSVFASRSLADVEKWLSPWVSPSRLTR